MAKYKSLNVKKPLTKISIGIPFWDKVIIVLFFTGLLLIIWEIFLFRKTIIDVKILLCIFLLPGIILTPFLYKLMNKIDGAVGHWILHYFLHTVIVGGILMFSFMSLNYYGASEIESKESFLILTKGSLPGNKSHRSERKPYAVINYHGLEKQLVFSNSFENEMKSATKSILITKRGLFGFAILKSYNLE